MGDVSREEHKEFIARMQAEHSRLDDENKRQNKRLERLEQQLARLNTLTTSVEKLANNMTNMLRELERQGNRLEALESRDGERWRQAIGYVMAAVVGAACTAVFSRWGI